MMRNREKPNHLLVPWVVLACVLFGFINRPLWSKSTSFNSACSALASVKSQGINVKAALYIDGGAFVPPVANGATREAPFPLPTHCAVVAETESMPDSQIEVDVWLPEIDKRNGMLLGTGNGGYSSARSYGDMADGLSRGYVVAGSNTGHEGNDIRFGAGHPQKIQDWAYRSTHELAVVEKLIAKELYGENADH